MSTSDPRVTVGVAGANFGDITFSRDAREIVGWTDEKDAESLAAVIEDIAATLRKMYVPQAPEATPEPEQRTYVINIQPGNGGHISADAMNAAMAAMERDAKPAPSRADLERELNEIRRETGGVLGDEGKRIADLIEQGTAGKTDAVFVLGMIHAAHIARRG